MPELFPLFNAFVLFDQSVADRNDAMGSFGDIMFVRNYNDRVALRVKLLK